MATASFVLGIIGLIAWLIPLFGLPITIVGLCLGASAMSQDETGTAKKGKVMCIIGLVLTVVNMFGGAILAVSGRMF